MVWYGKYQFVKKLNLIFDNLLGITGSHKLVTFHGNLLDLNITRTTTITTSILEVIKSQKVWTQDHTGLYTCLPRGMRQKTAVKWECSNRVAFSCQTASTIDLQMKTVTSSTPHTYDTHIRLFQLPSHVLLCWDVLEVPDRPSHSFSNVPVEVCTEFGNPETISGYFVGSGPKT